MTSPSRLCRCLLIPATFGALLTAGACSPAAPITTCDEADVVVGLVAQDQLIPQLQRYEITATDARGPLAKQVWDATSVTPPFPAELALRVRADAPVTVRVEGFAGALRDGNDPAPPPPGLRSAIVRTAVVIPGCGPKRLLRMRLESSCASDDTLGGLACGAGQTCSAGTCVSSNVAPASLETYTSNWPQTEPDSCSKPNGGPPQVFVGTGQTDYLALASGAEVRAEAGPQGGHHIWVAVRMTQLNQNGTTITITGVQPDTGLKAPRTSVVFSFEPDEGGFCKVYGIRYQLDGDGQPIENFLGRPLDVTAELRDRTGRLISATTHLRVATTLL